MGRAKLKMELIGKEKNRILTYKKRKEGLIKKLHQLTTLCDVGACMIIEGAAVKQSPDLEIWPPGNPNEVRRLIEIYKSKSRELGSVKTYGLSDFFNEREREVEAKLHKLRKKNSEANYPTWDDNLNSMGESQLRSLAAALHSKAHSVRSRIDFLKMREKQELEAVKNMMVANQDFGQFWGYADEGFTNMVQTGGFGTPIMYDGILASDLIGYQQYCAPPQPVSSYAPPPPANVNYKGHVGYGISSYFY